MELTEREWSMIRSALNMASFRWRDLADDTLMAYGDLPDSEKSEMLAKQYKQVQDTYYELAKEYKELWNKVRKG
jgi:hypothetical protein